MTVTAARALDGLTVVEWGRGRASAYAGRLLADFGASVTILEGEGTRARAFAIGPQPEADAQLDARVRFLHGGKCSALFDANEAVQRERFMALLDHTDVLVLEQHVPDLDALGLSPESLHERFPNLIVVAITFAGLQQGVRHYVAADLAVNAASGILFGTGGTVPSLREYPPHRPGGYQGEYTAGLAAATAALLGSQLRKRTGEGALFDTSMQAAQASFMRMSITYTLYEASDVMNLGYADRLAKNGKRSTLWGLVPCKDGFFAFQASEQYQWDGLMKMMGNPEWAKLPQFAEPLERARRWDEIEPHFVAWCMEHPKTEIFHTAQANHVPVFPCYNIEELIEDPQQRARGFLVDIPAGDDRRLIKVPGAMMHLDRSPWSHDPVAPAPGEHTAEVFGAALAGGVR